MCVLLEGGGCYRTIHVTTNAGAHNSWPAENRRRQMIRRQCLIDSDRKTVLACATRAYTVAGAEVGVHPRLVAMGVIETVVEFLEPHLRVACL
jgi:hypothetical protein